MEIIKEYFTLPEDQQPAFILKHLKCFTKSNMTKYFNETEAKKYYYLVTFTLKPEAVGDSLGAEDYIRKQFTQRKALGVQEAYMVKEQTKNDTDHWHVAVCTDKPLAKNRFSYYTKLYGFIDISKNIEKTLTNALEYISKSNTPCKLV